MYLSLFGAWITICTKGLHRAKADSINKFSFGSENGEVCGHSYLDPVPTRSLFPTLISCLLLINSFITLLNMWSQIAKRGLMHQLCHYGSEFCLLSSLAHSFHSALTSFDIRSQGFPGLWNAVLISSCLNLPGLPNSSLTVQECPQPILCLNYFIIFF